MMLRLLTAVITRRAALDGGQADYVSLLRGADLTRQALWQGELDVVRAVRAPSYIANIDTRTSVVGSTRARLLPSMCLRPCPTRAPPPQVVGTAARTHYSLSVVASPGGGSLALSEQAALQSVHSECARAA